MATKNKSEYTYCLSCKHTTKSIRLGRAYYICNRCNANKTLGDLLSYEAIHPETDKQKTGDKNEQK